MPRRKITPEQRDLVAQLVKKFEDEPAPDFGDLDDLNIDFDFDDLSYTPAPQPVPCKTPARIAPTTGTIKTSITL